MGKLKSINLIFVSLFRYLIQSGTCHKKVFKQTNKSVYLSYLILQSFEVNPAILLLLNVPKELGVHGHRVHEERLDRRVVSDRTSTTRVGLHAVHENFNLKEIRGKLMKPFDIKHNFLPGARFTKLLNLDCKDFCNFGP